MTIPNITLNNGVEMPQEGFGVYQIADYEACKQAVKDALSVGYRAIDTAQAYHNEEAVGQAIAESEVDRQDIFITTKVWITNYGYEATKQSVLDSLDKLQTNYLDLVLLHQPYNDYYGAYRALEDLQAEGKLRAIGVSNFYADRYVDLVKFNRVVPQVNQLETHVFYQREEDNEYLKKYGTQIESWGPFAEGRNNFFDNETLQRIGDKYHKSVAQVALRFLTQKGVVIIPKSTHKERMQENLDIWDFELLSEDMQEIQSLDTKQSYFFDHEDPETVESITASTL